jgi:hypothetical protein
VSPSGPNTGRDPGIVALWQTMSTDPAAYQQEPATQSPLSEQSSAPIIPTGARMEGVSDLVIASGNDGETEKPLACDMPPDEAHLEKRHDSHIDAKESEAIASAAIAQSENIANQREADSGAPMAKRVDSAQNDAPQATKKDPSLEDRASHSKAKSPLLKLDTTPPNSGHTMPPPANDTIASSPTLRRHAVQVPEGSANHLPAVQAPPTPDAGATSPKSERLPSIRHLTGQLPELAEAAATQEHRPYSHHHSQSFGSATSQSPMIPYHNFPPTAETSPSSQYPMSAQSPTSTVGDIPRISAYGSPTQYPPAAYYPGRRPSAPAEAGPPLLTPLSGSTPTPSDGPPHPPFPASLPSASSSGESQGHTGSSTDGYSTTHTTPIDSAVTDGNSRALPMPAGMAPNHHGYTCDYPGCNAAPFQTQYLLRCVTPAFALSEIELLVLTITSSHRNVHSSSRPHYCPVKDCPRSEGGKGFKRKNEMIRHGLVHKSPGYVCPFCPDREHKYPRPDNLQR